MVDALLPANAGLLCIIKAMCRPGLLCRRPCARRYAYNDRLAREFARARLRHWCNTDTRDADADDDDDDTLKAYVYEQGTIEPIALFAFASGYLYAKLSAPINFT